MPHTYTLRRHAGRYAVCRLDPDTPAPTWGMQGRFWSATRTQAELSVVCAQEQVPPGVTAARDWVLYEVAGPFDFGVTGVLAALSGALAGAGVALLALATYDTDYLLVKADQADAAEAALHAAGHTVQQEPTGGTLPSA